MEAEAKAEVLVTVRALIQRINRKLVADGEVLRKTREHRGEGVSRMWLDVGDYYVVDLSGNFVVDKYIDLESYARELGVLRPWEAIHDSGSVAGS